MNYTISFVMPALNEAANIEQAVRRAAAALEKYAAAWEIIVVNDGSGDDTGAIIDRLAQEIPGLRPLHHEKNRGYGAALRNAFSVARNDLLFFTDSDQQFDPNEIALLLPLSAQCDIVAGYRIRRRDPAIRLFTSYGYNTLIRILFRLPVRDINCAFKLIHRRVFESIALESGNFFINAELLCKARAAGFSVREIGVTHFPRRAGAATIRANAIFTTLRELSAMRRSLRTGARKNK